MSYFTPEVKAHLKGYHERDEVEASEFSIASTPKHDESPNFVLFVPNFIGCRIRGGRSKSKTVRLQKNNIGRYYSMFGTGERLPDQFVVSVGVMDGNVLHQNVNGEDAISYDELFSHLKHLGYDPLRPIRDPSYIAKKEREMGEYVIGIIEAYGKRGVTNEIKTRLRRIGNEIRDFCKDYIIGGQKPALAPSTLKTRKWKAANYPNAVYPSGLSMPLSETGQLAEAITCDVEAYRSQARADYLEEQREAARERKAKQKEKKAKAEKEMEVEGWTKDTINHDIRRRQESILFMKDQLDYGKITQFEFDRYCKQAQTGIRDMISRRARLFKIREGGIFNVNKFLEEQGRLE